MPEPITLSVEAAGDVYPVPLDRTCPDCDGTGYVPDAACPACVGEGVLLTKAGRALIEFSRRYHERINRY